jgi:phosphate transport system substrate-binding protein
MLAGWHYRGAFLLTALVACGCTKSSVKLDGSTTVYPVSEAVGEEFRKEHPDVRVIVGKSGTGGGMKKFSAGELDICDASRAIKDEEKQLCVANGVDYIELTIAYDGVSVVVNPENTWCKCLTVAQLKALWQPDSAVAKWSDLNPDWPDKKIDLFGPGTDNGTFEYFTEAIVGKAKSSRTDYNPSAAPNMLVTGVAGNKYALGYFGYAYYKANSERLKLLGVDSGDGNCVMPSHDTVLSNTYKPLSRPLFIYVRKSSLAQPEVAQYVKYYLDRVRSLVGDIGYVPAPDDVMAKDQQVLDEAMKKTTASAAGA